MYNYKIENNVAYILNEDDLIKAYNLKITEAHMFIF